MRKPGSVKEIEFLCVSGDVGIIDPRVGATATVEVSLTVASMSDGMVVSGVIGAPWHDTCRRCLADIDAMTRTEVRELYQLTVTDPDAFPVIGDQIDLTSMVREAVELDLAMAPLCRDDCAGLCPTCGIDLNLESCACQPAPMDPRWAALDVWRDDL